MRPVGLKARGRIGIGGFIAVQTKSIASPGTRGCDDSAKMAIGLAIEGMIRAINHDADRGMRRRPDAKIGPGRSQFGADGSPPREHCSKELQAACDRVAPSAASVAPAARWLYRRRLGGGLLLASEPLAVQPASRRRYACRRYACGATPIISA